MSVTWNKVVSSLGGAQRELDGRIRGICDWMWVAKEEEGGRKMLKPEIRATDWVRLVSVHIGGVGWSDIGGTQQRGRARRRMSSSHRYKAHPTDSTRKDAISHC